MNGDNDSDNKRMRTSSSPIRSNEFNITNLPNGLFADIAAYLPKPSRALFDNCNDHRDTRTDQAAEHVIG